jgi:Cysteine rich repeat
MRQMSPALVLAGLALLCVPHAPAVAQNPVEDALEDCSGELKQYCSQVKPGGGRLLACAQAHEDKLSPQCVASIVRASYLLDVYKRTIVYVGVQCAPDAKKYCTEVEPGEERIVKCLKSKKPELTKYCSLALKDVGQD